MGFVFTRNLQKELNEVDQLFEKSLAPWWEELLPLVKGLESDTTWKSLPVFTMAVYRYMNIERKLSIVMTTIFKNLYLASRIHETVKDDQEGQEYNQNLQFSILIGDFIFGRVLKLLLEAEALELLETFAKMICEINEGMTLKYKTDSRFIDNIEKTRVPLYATAFYTAACLNGCDEFQREIYKRLGHDLGFSVLLVAEPGSHKDVEYFVSESHKKMRLLNLGNNLTEAAIKTAIDELHSLLNNLDEVAAV